ncbi:hypothetical protein [Mycolicibacterium arseniciresistens]|jgi:hypothetical protein|uniref:Uncharacterized protein n=1 Tax=Mycolicibacterium arseniciresistens TaxID=3062257 RepID=A0ABT8UHP9_9MYCO|nr:hypothetical protein [Mycolicibacterium arseniciresistens]MDO3635714.1 hypothetical protein [Mycolicibacterium arseniciresistens]
MTSQEPTTPATEAAEDEVLAPATPGAEALPADDSGDSAQK